MLVFLFYLHSIQVLTRKLIKKPSSYVSNNHKILFQKFKNQNMEATAIKTITKTKIISEVFFAVDLTFEKLVGIMKANTQQF